MNRGYLAGGSFACLTCALASCTPLYGNKPLMHSDAHSGYRFDNLEVGERNSDDLFICLAFSGGGTRAAAFSYGVLKGLGETPIPAQHGGQVRTLLDEIDVISSVSGGSFTAMGYGLWRNQLFDGRFEQRFLKHNVEGSLALRALNPVNLLALPFPGKDSIDLATEYYDQEIFQHATYADLLQRRTRPFLMVNATDVARKIQFTFTQQSFDMLGSDLAELPVANAVAASSAFPVLLTPLRLKYYHNEVMQHSIHGEMQESHTLLGHKPRHTWARSLIDLPRFMAEHEIVMDEQDHRYLYLIDGGVVDNLGMDPILESYRDGAIREHIQQKKIKRLVVIIVDSGVEHPNKVEHSPSAPSRLGVLGTTATSGISTNTAVITQITRYVMLEAEPRTLEAYQKTDEVIRENCPTATPPTPPNDVGVEYYVVDVTFRNVHDDAERHRLLTLPTNFDLKPDVVDDLVRMGQTLLTDHPEFQRLMKDLGT